MNTPISLLLRTYAAFTLILVSSASVSAKTRDVIHKTFDMAGPGQLAIAAKTSDITITTWDQPQVDVTITRVVSASNEAREKEILGNDQIDVGVVGNKLTVTLDVPGRWGIFKARRDYRVEIKAPAACSAGLRTSCGDVSVEGLEGGVEARTSGGDMSLGHIGGDVKALTSGGDVRVDSIAGAVVASTSGGDIHVINGTGKLTANTSGGDVRVENQKGDIDAGTSGGDIDLSGISGAVSASTSGGDVSASFVAQPSGSVKLKTTGGDASIVLPANAAVHIDARTTGGSIITDFPLNKPEHGFSVHMLGDINGGGPSVELYTTGGSVHISKGK